MKFSFSSKVGFVNFELGLMDLYSGVWTQTPDQSFTRLTVM